MNGRKWDEESGKAGFEGFVMILGQRFVKKDLLQCLKLMNFELPPMTCWFTTLEHSGFFFFFNSCSDSDKEFIPDHHTSVISCWVQIIIIIS